MTKYLALVYGLLGLELASTAFVLAVEPFHFIRNLSVPNVYYLPDGAALLLNFTVKAQPVFVSMPPHTWPADVSALPPSEQGWRWTFWISFTALVYVAFLALGTAFRAYPRLKPRTGQHDRLQGTDELLQVLQLGFPALTSGAHLHEACVHTGLDRQPLMDRSGLRGVGEGPALRSVVAPCPGSAPGAAPGAK